MESYSQAVGFGFLLPAFASFICLIAAARWTSPRLRALAGVLIFAVVVVCYHLLGLGPLRPAENWQWLPWLGLIACLIDAISLNKWILWILYIVFAVLAAWLLVPDVDRLADVHTIWLVAFPLLLLAALASTIFLGQKLAGPALPFWLLLATLAGAFLVFFASLAKFAQLGGILAGMLVGCLAAAWWKPTRGLTAAIAPGWAALWSGLIVEAKLATFSETPLASFLLVLAAPFTIWLTLLPPLRKMNPVWRTALGALLLAIPTAVGLYLAGRVAMSDMEEW